MADQKTTGELERILQNTSDLNRLEMYLEDLNDIHLFSNFREYFRSLPKVQALDAATIIARSGMERTYYYQIMNGTRNPGRDKIILLSIAAGLTVKETQQGLKYASAGPLYAKDRRDAIILFSLSKSLNCIDTNELLDQFGEKLL